MAYKLFIKKKKKRKEKLVIHALNSSQLLQNDLGNEADDFKKSSQPNSLNY
jgi:hypothetical protein